MEQPPIEAARSVRPVVIEVHNEPVGVVVPAGVAWRFVAVKFPVFVIDGAEFASVAEAQSAAVVAMTSKRDAA